MEFDGLPGKSLVRFGSSSELIPAICELQLYVPLTVLETGESRLDNILAISELRLE
jgi:hypothetical protein